MAKRTSVGRINRMRNLSNATVQNIATYNPCATKPTTVYGNEVVSGTTFARLATFTAGSPGTVTPQTPLSYLYVSGTSRAFLLGDNEAGNADLCPSGSNKIIVAAAAGPNSSIWPDGAVFNISASLPPPATHIIMEEGARVELTWVPERSGPGNNPWASEDPFLGLFPGKGYWASGLVLSGSTGSGMGPYNAPTSSVGPQAYLTTGSV